MNSHVQDYFDSSSSSEDDEFDDLFEMDDEFDEMTLLMIEEVRPWRAGSQPGRVTILRDRLSGHNQLVRDYFADVPVYPPHLFRRRFRMSRDLFRRIVTVVEANNYYFKRRRNAAGLLGFSALQKVTAAMRVIAYGTPADYADEYLRIGEDTTLASVRELCKTVIEVFGEQYLRAPNAADTERLHKMNEARGFLSMVGSIDCMHWEWKNCPTAWHGQFTGHKHDPTIILEAVASQDLWIWHAYFGMPGSHNDINVLQRSPLFARLANGEAPPFNFSVNGHEYNMGYYLADGIYPAWSTFVKAMHHPHGNKQAYFAKAQAAARKDVERAFGVLHARFAIVRGPARFWDQHTLWQIMTSCVIMHNMIIEDEGEEENDFEYYCVGTPVVPAATNVERLNRFLEVYRRIEDRCSHEQLRDDLIEHLWQFHGGQ